MVSHHQQYRLFTCPSTLILFCYSYTLLRLTSTTVCVTPSTYHQCYISHICIQLMSNIKSINTFSGPTKYGQTFQLFMHGLRIMVKWMPIWFGTKMSFHTHVFSCSQLYRAENCYKVHSKSVFHICFNSKLLLFMLLSRSSIALKAWLRFVLHIRNYTDVTNRYEWRNVIADQTVLFFFCFGRGENYLKCKFDSRLNVCCRRFIVSAEYSCKRWDTFGVLHEKRFVLLLQLPQ